ncbi:MAG: archaemetzincin family Zn-dependent metalloprotease [Thermoleophilia bacterium]
MEIMITPYGTMAPELPERLAAGLNRAGRGSAALATPRPLPPGAFDQRRDQYSSRAFLEDLRAFAAAATDAEGTLPLGLVAVDLFVPRMSFVFGEAAPENGTAVISAFRLRPDYYGRPADDGLLVERLLKEAIHEHGHVAGFSHCADPCCIMYFSSAVEDTDRKEPRLCPRCEARRPQVGAGFLY